MRLKLGLSRNVYAKPLVVRAEVHRAANNEHGHVDGRAAPESEALQPSPQPCVTRAGGWMGAYQHVTYLQTQFQLLLPSISPHLPPDRTRAYGLIPHRLEFRFGTATTTASEPASQPHSNTLDHKQT